MNSEPKHPNDKPAAVLWPAVQVGAFSGAAGLLVGGTAGVLRSTTPVLFATASGVQWFALGTTYWTARGTILNYYQSSRRPVPGGPAGRYLPTADDRVHASALAGGITGGAVAALTRGFSNVVPGIIMFSGFGYVGQKIYNSLDAQKADDNANNPLDPKKSFWERVSESRWSPMKVLTSEEYEQMLQEKLLKVDVEIALVDEAIEKLKQEKTENPNEKKE